MTTVYLVLAGNQYEGLGVSAVFDTQEKANSYLLAVLQDDQCYLMDKEHDQFDIRIEQHRLN